MSDATHKNGVEQNESRARVVSVEHSRLEPLYPATRVLTRDALQSEQLLAAARHALVEAQGKAERMVGDARSDAERIRKQALEAAESARARALEDGRKLGACELARAIAKLERESIAIERAASIEVRRLAASYARAILDVEFRIAPERIVDLVERVLGRARAQRRIEVHLYPSDAPYVRAALGELQERLGLTERVQVVEDNSLAVHTVRIASEWGVYDGSVDAQLQPLLDELAARAACRLEA